MTPLHILYRVSATSCTRESNGLEVRLYQVNHANTTSIIIPARDSYSPVQSCLNKIKPYCIHECMGLCTFLHFFCCPFLLPELSSARLFRDSVHKWMDSMTSFSTFQDETMVTDTICSQENSMCNDFFRHVLSKPLMIILSYVELV